VCANTRSFVWLEVFAKSFSAMPANKHAVGAAILESSFVTVHNSRFEGHNNASVLLEGNISNSRNNNNAVSQTFAATSGSGISVVRSKFTNIVSNQITQANNDSILVSQSEETNALRNSIKEASKGIFVELSPQAVVEGNNISLATSSIYYGIKLADNSIVGTRSVLLRNTIKGGGTGILWSGHKNQSFNNLVIGSTTGHKTRPDSQVSSCNTAPSTHVPGGYVYNFGYLDNNSNTAIEDCTGYNTVVADKSKYGGKFARNNSTIQIGNAIQLALNELLEGVNASAGGFRFSDFSPVINGASNFSNTAGINSSSVFTDHFFTLPGGFTDRFEPKVTSGLSVYRTIADFIGANDQCSTELSSNFGTSADFVNHFHNAQEILADGFGNDNGLCERGETCEFAPFIGEHQGKGNLNHQKCFIYGVMPTDEKTKVIKLDQYGYSL
jgi:hypothetical protein